MSDKKNPTIDAIRQTALSMEFGGQTINDISELDTPAADDKGGNENKDQENNSPEISGEIETFETEVPTDSTENDAQNADSGEDKGSSQTNPDEDAKYHTLLKTLGQQAKESNLLDFSPEEFEKAEDKEAYFAKKLEDTISNRTKSAIEQELENYKSENLPAEINELIELHKKGVPLHSILEADRNIASLEGITEEQVKEDVELQKGLIAEFMKAQGFNDEKIKAKIKRLEDLAALEDESKDALEALITLEKEEKQKMIKAETERKQNQIKERDAKIQEITAKINQTKEFIPGFALSQEDKQKMIDGFTKVIGKDKQNRPITPLQKAYQEDPELAYKVAYFALVLKGDLGKVKAKAETSVTRNLRNLLESTDKFGSSQHDNTRQSASKTDKSVMREALRALK